MQPNVVSERLKLRLRALHGYVRLESLLVTSDLHQTATSEYLKWVPA